MNWRTIARASAGGCLGAALALIVSGCSTPMTKVNPATAAALPPYRKIYFPISKDDPRKVQPRVVSRLRQTGFEVVEIREDGPPIEAQGTGFVITSAGHVLTCAHVLEGTTNATVWIE